MNITTDQKQAIMVLMNLYNDHHIDEEQYFLLLDFIISDTKDETPSSTDKITFVPCSDPKVPYTNPFHDCIGCPRQFGDGNYTTVTNKVEEQQ